ncbi:double-strand-break repair protein rad21-like protein 1 [Hemicordylus capensis]|uniref:double-strand-break repair protein rad21-like protein 1 n=1 Tax=Hemicordylus capensis TaxID=884348 RepID=UPI0023031A5B|nr:double-strand-break repair protein rad21-like protein 1 [Hemicordylus capensis]
MFYMQLLMNKRGPLAKIWLAAHWDKKLTKAHIFECNLETTVEKILSPKFKIALRTSGHLLLGVVRIYHRKAKYLLADCSEALLKMQSAFRPGLVDLPKGSSEANYNTITLPEEFHDFDTQLPEVNAIDVAQHFTLNQSRAEDITLIEEDYRQDILLHGGIFGEETEIPRQHSFISDSLPASSSILLTNHSSLNLTGEKTTLDELELKHDGFGDEGIAGDMIDDVLGTEQNNLIIDLDMEEEIPPPQDDDILDYLGDEGAKSCQINETTLLSNDEEGFVLEPIDDTVLIRKQRGKRKRKLLVDAVKELSRDVMQKQLMNYKDTLTTLDIAPPTRKLMILQEQGGVDKLFNRSTQPLINEDLQMLFARSLRNGRKRLQQDSEAREISQEQDAQELPIEERSGMLQGMLQETVFPETSLQNGRAESGSSGAVNMVSALSDGSLLDSSATQEAERQQAVVENEVQGSDLDNEEKRRSRRTLELLNTFQQIDQTGARSFSFLALCKNKNNKEVSTKFYSLLVLNNQLAINLAQAAPYADIIVTVGPKFHTI